MLWTLLGLGRDTWAYELRLLSIHFLHSFFFWALLANIRAGPAHFSTSLPLLGFIRPHSYYASPFHSLGFLSPFHSSGFLGPFSSSSFFLPLLPLWTFAKSFGFSQPNYHVLTSLPFRLIGLFAIPMNLLIHFLGFLDPFTSSLPLIIPMGLLLHSLSFLGPFASSLPLIIFCGPVDHYSYHSGLLVFTLLFSLPIFFILLGFFCH